MLNIVNKELFSKFFSEEDDNNIVHLFPSNSYGMKEDGLASPPLLLVKGGEVLIVCSGNEQDCFYFLIILIRHEGGVQWNPIGSPGTY
ncbi:MAG: hypothetical protein D8M57_16975 [Candidatus Scalindua sp. AMX11]|nr:MAG: hypothetical protein DWQ00_12710 [Candidatus Scalindua sp.]TDE63717.1 MAG: hypothetical protein D8M57_16975 [Candidatus Scalindua sp. AMX11]